MTFSDQLEPRAIAPGKFTFDMPDQWQQGRGAFGGLVLGALARAAIRCEPEADRRLRSLTGEIAGPVLPGPAELDAVVMRRGNALTVVRVSLTQRGEELAHAVCVLGRDRTGTPEWQRLAAPSLPAWQDTFAPEFDPAIWPTFTQHFEFRPVGPLPYGGADEPAASGWIRPRNGGTRDEAWVCAVADAWWPAAAATFDWPRPTATIAFMLQLVGGARVLDAEAPLFHRAYAPASAGGYAVETRELWSADGHLVSLNQQTFAIIK